ncbi:helix-turn-helix domain-containing protein [Paraburkholderia phytofirmans]|uniref:Resolvase helix-turn-helix domain protein n=1 Tax=Paraburkholderia phytofirmans (strain DSM 17436 / LMG 22146 / PsJN) TaxID=398527 RepID=B2TGW6_PARPJ|nr:helix-turn-helix domain-containing protein [Paraburkholderia phytofirmans]ACD21682.1 Resolvase helix-turn-helix domain protein [Paraburkholderia phytofirmans PsJN]
MNDRQTHPVAALMRELLKVFDRRGASAARTALVAEARRIARQNPCVETAITESVARLKDETREVSSRPRGRSGGKKECLSETEQAQLVRMYLAGMTGQKIAGHFGVARGTVYRYLEKHGAVGHVERQA